MSSVRSAAERALDVLRTVQSADAESGMPDDPSVVDAIRQLERALRVPARERAPRNKWGFRFGEPLRVVGGKLAGCTAEYVRACSSDQMFVRYNGATFAVKAHFVERAA